MMPFEKQVYVIVDTLPWEGRADTIIVVAAGCPETNDWEEVGETSVPWGVVMTRPATVHSAGIQTKWKEITANYRHKRNEQWTLFSCVHNFYTHNMLQNQNEKCFYRVLCWKTTKIFHCYLIAAGQNPYQLIYGFWSNWGCNFKVSWSRRGWNGSNLEDFDGQRLTCCHYACGWNRQQVLGAMRWGHDSGLSTSICLCPRCGDGENSCLVVWRWGRGEGNTLVLLLFHLVQEHGILYLTLGIIGFFYNKYSSKIKNIPRSSERYYSDLPVRAQRGLETKNMMN